MLLEHATDSHASQVSLHRYRGCQWLSCQSATTVYPLIDSNTYLLSEGPDRCERNMCGKKK